jgi:glycosyltransferase involved in cell wall biosynthesis
MKIALVHDFLFEFAGSERVVEQIFRVFPQADLFTMFDFLPPEHRFGIGSRQARTTFLQSFPLLNSNTANWLPLAVPFMPRAIEQLDLNGYDLVLSSSHSFAKGVRTGPDQLHISYLHSPMRFAWDRQADYLRTGIQAKWPFSWIARGMFSYLRAWDARTAQGVDRFIANSKYVSQRIWENYQRESRVIYPPVDVSGFDLYDAKEDTYLVVSRLVPYKRIDLIIQAFNRLPGRRLAVIGSGPELGPLRKLAGPNVELLGYQSTDKLRFAMQRARALIIVAVEDFGIAPIEAQACGTPVIALRRGGAAETVVGIDQARPTGLFFEEQDVDSIRAAVADFEKRMGQISPVDCRENAMRFSPTRFRQEYRASVEADWATFHAASPPGLIQPAVQEDFYVR